MKSINPKSIIRRARRGVTPRESNVRATVFNIQRAEHSTSRQIEAIDEFQGMVVSNNGSLLLPTPYPVLRLFAIREESNMLAQCIAAYVTNTVLTGWETDSLFRGKEASADDAHELQSFIDHANTEQSLTTVLSLVILDRETVGFGFLEVVRDLGGNISVLRHASSAYTRICDKHKEEILVENEIQRGRRVSVIREYRKFRKYVQIVGGKTVWFKEFGDPRRMNCDTGIFSNENGYTPGRDATELLHMRLPSNDPYGVPRWINQLPSIIGSREAELVNMRYFQDNTVPPMLLMIGNGRLTAASYNQLNQTLNENGIGSERQHKIMLLEAVGESDSMDGKAGNIDLKVEKLTDARQSDGLFKAYGDDNMAKVRSSFRLPPVLVGMSQDVNFATATTSVFVAESQVFAPDRSQHDEFLNKHLINGKNGLRLKTAKLTSRTPSITSPEMVIKTLTASNVMGAVTPRSAQKTINKMLQLELDEYPQKGEEGYEEWMDKPMSITAALEKTHAAQALKTQQEKDTEDTGDVSQTVPKNGEQ